jgi:chromatin licensing and DNA replication factor 1
LALQKRKVICLDRGSEFFKEKDEQQRKIVRPSNEHDAEKAKTTTPASLAIASIRQDITPQRTRAKRVQQMQNVEGIQTTKVVNFIVKGSLSPQKKSKLASQPTAKTDNATIEKTKEATSLEIQKEVFKTPTKNFEKTSINVEKTLLVPNNNNLNINEVSKKLRGSSRLSELKTSLNKLKSGFDKLDQMEKKRLAPPIRNVENGEGMTLKVFKNIEFEILR